MCFDWSQNYKNNAAYFINEFFITSSINPMRMKLHKVANWSFPLFAHFIEMRLIFQSPVSMTGDCRGRLSTKCESP